MRLKVAMAAMAASLAFGAAANAMVVFPGPAGSDPKFNWTFTDASGVVGQGVLNVDGNGDILSMTGTYMGQALTFYANPSFPGTSTWHGVPNTGGADFIYDDYVTPVAGSNNITAAGIVLSVGGGADERVYDLSLDYPGAGSADFFSITPNGGYVFDEGNFTLSVPEPATWAMMILGVGMIGLAARRRRGALVLAA